VSDQNTTITADGLARLLDQFDGSINLRLLAASYLDQAQALEGAAFPILTERGIDNMTGDRLDGLGSIVNEARGGRNDADYRLALKGELAVLQSTGTAEDLIAIAVLVLQVSGDVYDVVEYFPKTFYIRPVGPIGVDPIFATSMLKRAVSAATRLLFVYSLVSESIVFTLSSQASTSESSALLGLANLSQTTGGHLSQSL